MELLVTLDSREDRFDCRGDSVWGDSEPLLKGDFDLLKRCPWAPRGYTVEKFLEPSEFEKLLGGVTALLKRAVEKVSGCELLNFQMEKYHTYIKDSEAHRLVLQDFERGLEMADFPASREKLEKKVSDLLQFELTTAHPSGFFDRYHLRIVRPFASDYNPLHKDGWLDRLRNGINLYIPLAGSNEHSSLPVIPESHWWLESDICRTRSGGQMNGVQYSVPCVTASRRPLTLVRPNPAPNEFMIFSPYLLHGLGVNRNTDKTRVSLEIRLWQRPLHG